MKTLLLNIFILFLILTFVCFGLSYYFNIKALKYTEKEEETMAVKNGLLYLLFGTYCDLFLKLSVVLGVINIGVKFF